VRAGHGVPGSRVVGCSRTRGIGPLWLIEVTGKSGRKNFADYSSRTSRRSLVYVDESGAR